MMGRELTPVDCSRRVVHSQQTIAIGRCLLVSLQLSIAGRPTAVAAVLPVNIFIKGVKGASRPSYCRERATTTRRHIIIIMIV